MGRASACSDERAAGDPGAKHQENFWEGWRGCGVGEAVASGLGVLAFVDAGRWERVKEGRAGYCDAQRHGGCGLRWDFEF